MKFKVTVEFEEGVKSTSVSQMTAESVILTVNGLNSQSLDQQLVADAQNAAAHSMQKILTYLKTNGLLAQRNKGGTREVLQVKDVDEASEWLKKGDAA